MSSVRFPVFVRARNSGDMWRFTSIAELQRELERIDVENEEYEAWDAVATPVRLTILKRADWLQLEPTGPPQPKQLIDAIQEFARREDVEADESALNRGDYSGALEQVTSATSEAQRSDVVAEVQKALLEVNRRYLFLSAGFSSLCSLGPLW